MNILFREVQIDDKEFILEAHKEINQVSGLKESRFSKNIDKDLFQDKLTLVIIVVHEKQKNMDIDNKYVKPIIDGLVTSGVIKDDNFSNMFYIAMGKNDTKKPYTEAFVLDGKYIDEWIEDLEKLF